MFAPVALCFKDSDPGRMNSISISKPAAAHVHTLVLASSMDADAARIRTCSTVVANAHGRDVEVLKVGKGDRDPRARVCPNFRIRASPSLTIGEQVACSSSLSQDSSVLSTSELLEMMTRALPPSVVVKACFDQCLKLLEALNMLEVAVCLRLGLEV